MIGLDPAVPGPSARLLCDACGTGFNFYEYDDRHQDADEEYHADCCPLTDCNPAAERTVSITVRRQQAGNERRKEERRIDYERYTNERRKAERRGTK